ncbi:MAG: MarR family EPS-associated transcriptional regulator [Pseudomonadales bacterium]
MPQESHYHVLKLIEQNPQISQRELAKELGISLGKANYCLKSLVDKGWVKVNNFKNSNNKMAYAYLLTPKGIENKASLTVRFLKTKIEEYEKLKAEIEQLSSEISE